MSPEDARRLALEARVRAAAPAPEPVEEPEPELTVEEHAARLRELEIIPYEDIIGPHEIRELAGGVSRKTLHTWQHREGFPQPFRVLAVGGLYDRRQIIDWLRDHRIKRRD